MITMGFYTETAQSMVELCNTTVEHLKEKECNYVFGVFSQ